MTAWIEELTRALGPSGVRAARGDRFLYAYDAALEKRVPAAVALPRDAAQAAAAASIAARHGVPYAARGAGTNLCGGSVPAEGGLVIHFARMNRVLSIDPARRRARVQPGVVNLHLQNALAPHGLFYAPDPASQKACTLGGNVGTNAGGPHCLKYGVTSTHVTALETVWPDGRIVRSSVDEPGYDLTGLGVGAEGTLGLVTEIELNLLAMPPTVETLLAAFSTMEAAGQAVADTIAAGVVPSTLEVMDRLTLLAVEDFVKAGYPRDAAAVLLIELDGAAERVRADADTVRRLCRKNGATDLRAAADAREREKLWEGRRGAYPALARLAPNVLVEDGVVPRARLPEALRRVRAIADREGLRMGLIAHAGDGNLHPNIVFDERNADETRRVKEAGQEMLRACVEMGGSISGEHGIGTDKREAMRWLFTPETLRLFRRIKTAVDPAGVANPEKLIPTVDSPDSPPPAPAAAGARPDRASSIEDVRAALVWAASGRRPLAVAGAGRRLIDGGTEAVLDTTGLDRILDHDAANFVLTVQAGARAADVARFLEGTGQFLHLRGDGTLGGLLSRNAGGRPRDQVLAVTAVLPGGDVVRLGARVVKNVAGYDAAKLLIGAWGTLGVLVDVTLRLHPVPDDGAPPPAAPPPDFAAREEWVAIKKAFDPENLLNPRLSRRP